MNGFGDIFGGGDFEEAIRRAGSRKAAANPTPLPQIRGKDIDGALYVRAEDVADALAVLGPAVNKRLIDKLRGWVSK